MLFWKYVTSSGSLTRMRFTPYLLNEIVSIYTDDKWPDAGQYHACEKFEASFISLALK